MPELWQDLVISLLLGLFTYGATNIDNLLIVAAIGAGRERFGKVAKGFGAATLAVMLAAGSFAALSLLIPPEWLGYLGVIPILLGTKLLLWKTKGEAADTVGTVTPRSLALLLVANSTDTIAAFGPLVAESEPAAKYGLFTGLVLGAFTVLLLSRFVARRSQRRQGIAARLDSITPFIMIAVGIYILADTGTDTI